MEKNLKSQAKIIIYKTSRSTCNKEIKLPDGSYYVSDIQDYFEYIIKNHETDS